MYKFFSLTLVALYFSSCKAQIIPVEQHITYINSTDENWEIPDGAYIKDVNNLLDPYVGTWLGAHNNRNYEFYITESTSSFLGISKDLLLIRYKVTIASSGDTLADTSSLPDDSPLVVNGSYFNSPDADYYTLRFIGENIECNQKGKVFVSLNSNPNEMRFSVSQELDTLTADDCSDEIDLILPIEQIALIKQ